MEIVFLINLKWNYCQVIFLLITWSHNFTCDKAIIGNALLPFNFFVGNFVSVLQLLKRKRQLVLSAWMQIIKSDSKNTETHKKG